jgi:FkbM family methyltransferase
LHCIEPTPSHYALLKELIGGMGADTNLTYAPYALTGTEGEFLFATGHSTENKVTSAGDWGSNKITVEGHQLSWFLAHAFSGSTAQHIDFCKIDIEGGEMMALTIEQLKFAYGKVKTFFVEVHPAFGGGMDENREELIRRFEHCGYEVEQIDFQTIVATA